MFDRDQHLNILMMMFPMARFDHLQSLIVECSDEEGFEDVVDGLLANDDYPRKEASRDDAKIESDRRFRVEPFDVVDFLKEYTYDPLKYFAVMKRDMVHKDLSLSYLKKRFKTIRVEYIEKILRQSRFNLMEAADQLRNPPASEIQSQDRLSGDLPEDLDTTDWPVRFKREVQFFEHKSEVMEYLELVKEMKTSAVREKTNLSCECCWDEDILIEEAVACEGGHIFCRGCLVRHAECKDFKVDVFKCIFPSFCTQRFPHNLLQKCFKPVKLAEIMNNWEKEVLRMAEVPGLETCPFCDYAAIAEPEDLIFPCQYCGIKSCRRCRRAYHSPLACQGDRANTSYRPVWRDQASGYQGKASGKQENPFFLHPSSLAGPSGLCQSSSYDVQRSQIRGVGYNNNWNRALYGTENDSDVDEDYDD